MDNTIIGDKPVINEKYSKYQNQYKPNEIYWGLGIENELYLEFGTKQVIRKEKLLARQKRERYSVDYYTNYKTADLNNAFIAYTAQYTSPYLNIPVLLNANSFTRTDMHNEPSTNYTKLNDANKKFSGETLIETLQNNNPYFKNTINNEWLFDGDTIEFNTLHFFNAKLKDVVDELSDNKRKFISQINDSFSKLDIFRNFGDITIMEQNHAFATYMTNINNISMFNNGTLHYNLTLPTVLNDKKKIKDKDKFIKDHAKAVKIIQWMEPFILAKFGSPDQLSQINGFAYKHLFSGASQRCAISRYIGIGTFNADEMQTGKILTIPTKELVCNNLDFWWFNEYYKNNAYNKLDDIGVDINFNKHYNHGIELRFLDHITDETKLYDSFEFIIYLMDYILETDEFINRFENPIINEIWNNVVLNTMIHGSNYNLTDAEKTLYGKIFGITIYQTKIVDIYDEIYMNLISKYNIVGEEGGTKSIPVGKFSCFTLANQPQKSSGFIRKIKQIVDKIENIEQIKQIEQVINKIENNEQVKQVIRKIENNEQVKQVIRKIENNEQVKQIEQVIDKIENSEQIKQIEQVIDKIENNEQVKQIIDKIENNEQVKQIEQVISKIENNEQVKQIEQVVQQNCHCIVM